MILQKLRSSRGFTLLETLIAVGILAIVVTVISTGMPVALHVYKEAVASSEAGVLASTLTEAIADEFRWATDPQTDGTYTSAVYGRGAKITVDDDGHLMIGAYPLVGERAYTNNLKISTFEYAYTDGKIAVKFAIADPDGKERKSVQFQIAPANDSNTDGTPSEP